MNTKHEICFISQFCPNVFSSFEHSFFSLRAYTDLHEAILAINNIALFKSQKKAFDQIGLRELEKERRVRGMLLSLAT
jgi:hypothetical protein